MDIDYRDLHDVISFEGFHFDRFTYKFQELVTLQPRLEKLGYTDVQWRDGEMDSFGPLSRTCSVKDTAGETVYFMYG